MVLKVQKGNLALIFKNCMETQNRCILGLELVPMTGHTAQMVVATYELKMTGLHKRLGHVLHDITTKTAKFYGWNVTGMPEDSESCELAKAQ